MNIDSMNIQNITFSYANKVKYNLDTYLGLYMLQSPHEYLKHISKKDDA